MSIECWQYGTGGGYPILYMHGATPMPFSDRLAQVIKENNLTVLEVLRPGYGKSAMLKHKSVGEYAKAFNGLVAKLELDRFDALGVSAGAPYAYALAALRPDKVGRVHICGGIPLDCCKDIYRMNSVLERFMFALSRVLPAGFIGKCAVSAMEAMEKKAGWKPHACGESMDQMFDNYVRPNWQGIGWSTHVQYKGWGFDPGEISCPVHIYYSKGDKMIPYRIAEASASKLKTAMLYPYEDEEHYSERMLEDLFKNARAKA